MKTENLFLRFLVTGGFLDAYLFNFYRDSSNPSLCKFFETYPSESYVSYAFIWSASPQGVEYWNNVESLWSEFLSSWQEQTSKAGGHRRQRRR